MPVFKAYFILIKKNLPMLIIYLGVFIFLTILFVKIFGSQATYDFSAVRTKVIVQNEESTPLTDALASYIGRNADVVTVGEGQDSVKDALFFGKAEYAVRIPAGFTESFMRGEGATLEKTAGAMSTSSVSMDMLLDKYLSAAHLYVKNVPGITQQELVRDVAKDLGSVVPVTSMSSVSPGKVDNLNYSFRYMGYAIMAIMLTGVVAIMMAFNSPELYRRNLCAPIRPSAMSMQLFLGNILFMLINWLALCIVATILGKLTVLSPVILLLCLNTLIFSVSAMSIAFLAGKFVKSDIALAAVANVVSLGVSFLSGIFVPQELLGGTVQKIASFTPGYWYVKAVNTITGMTTVTFDSIKPVLGDMLIQLGFAAACIAIALLVTKQKKQTLESSVAIL